ncbi:hypothetical protein HO173_004485 [Letharia columbiana]|uniref:RanBD1 domain-containing protein n=1 Tax=Letharia columbiana TaxID=112416 RepID=A0A8H6FZK2_9LECA|nr:uncharacterized protein HO173_004485 [Letharia columbiana]KAF6237595.1 hypothetical protein HO173_004485 [Letharia columbiana]
MAKRVADQQLTKDGTMSDEDGFSVGSQIEEPQRATAAQMAQRRLAKPRGGRRPGALRPPASPSLGMSQQQQQNSFGEGDRINMNGTQQQQGGFSFGQQPNGFQPNQNSSSFPPFPSNSFNPSFAAPTTGFSFNTGQAQDVNNPFTAINTHNAPPPEPTGFQGTIFNLPPQKMSPFQKFLEGEQKPLFAAGAPNISTSSQSPQPPSNPFNQSTDQQQSSHASLGIFSQSNAQQQPSNNAFGQSTEQKAPQPSTDMFAHLKTPQNQSSSNPFAQSISQFQQSQPAQPTANLFAHLGQPQTSSSFLTQGSTSPTQGGSSMMQTSPDPSPQSRPFGFLNKSNAQTQSSPTKDSTAQGGGGSLFDRVTKPPAETDSQSQSSPTKDTTAQGVGGSLFDRISKPSTETNAQTLFSPVKNNTATDSGNLFSMPQPPGTSKASNENGANSPTKIGERKIAKPTLFQNPSEDARPPYKAIFGSLKMPPTLLPSPSPAPSAPSAVSQPSPSQLKGDSASPTHGTSNVPSSSVSTQQSSERPKTVPDIPRKFGPSPAPEGYSEEEAKKWSQDWWVSFYVRHKEKRIKHAESQCNERIKAVLDGFDPLEQIVRSKRKSIFEDREGEEDEVLGKKARVEGPSIFTQESRGALSNGTSITQSPSKRDPPAQQATNKNNKRSADEEPERDNAQGTADNGKKARGHDPVSYPSLSATSPGSQTSSIFKNILDKKEETKVNGTQNDKATPLFQFQAPSGSSSTQSPSTFKPSSTTSVPLSSKPDTESPFKSSFASFNPTSSTPNSSLFANQQSTSNGAPVNSSTPSFKPSSSAAAPLTASKSGPFSFKPTTSSEAPSDATKALAVKFSSGATTSTASSANPFSAKPPTSGQTSSEAAKAPAFKVPTFGAAAASSASNPSPFSIKTSTGPTSSEVPNAPTFKVPTFGAGASSTNFISQFGKAAEKTAAEDKKKRKAADFDSDEEDLDSWERRDAEEQRMKKQKLEEEIKGKAAKLIDGKWVIAADADNEKPSTSANQAEPADPSISVLSQPLAPLTNGHNIFGHLSGEESGAEGSKTGDADDEDDEDEKDDETNVQHQVRGPFDYDDSASESDEDGEGQSKEPKALSNPFGASGSGLYDTAENANGEDTGRSLFDRVSRDKDGKSIREIPQADGRAVSQTSNIFGQSFKSGTSSNLFSPPSDAASSFTSANSKAGDSPKGDHTWKVDSPIKFGESGNPPAVNVTSPSPSKPAFGGLFGAAKPNVTTETPTKPTSSVSSTPPAKIPSVGFGFGFKPATASLAPPSNNGSNTTSRATSPGATTGESANESTADGEDDKAEKQEQIDLTSPGPGEEDEDVVLQVKAKALKWDAKSSSWASKGVGPLRVLKNRKSHQTRVLLRQDPSGRIVLNFALSKSFTYESSQSKTVRVPIVGESGKIESWLIKVGDDDDAKKLASALEENKS